MARRIPAKFIAFVLAIFGGCIHAQSEILADYNFDDQLLQPGPDTFRVFKTNENHASISYEFAQTGIASVHFFDPPHDGDFVEFQGYFTPQTSGTLSVEFGFLITEVASVFHFALTGENKYRLRNTGINFWIHYDGEWLRSYSNSIPKKVFQPQPFKWYTIRAQLDFDEKTYQLQVEDEHGKSLYSGENLLFAPGKHPQHSVLEYSFVGDIYDKKPSDFFIDNFLIDSSTDGGKQEFVAPGRRQLFVESWSNYQGDLQGKLQCLPAINLEDFSIDLNALGEIFNLSQMDNLLALTSEERYRPKTSPDDLHHRLIAIHHWRRGCEHLAAMRYAQADTEFDKALLVSPDAYIFQLSKHIVSASHSSSNESFLQISSLAHSDIRNDIALAMISFHQGVSNSTTDIPPPELPQDVSQYIREMNQDHRNQLARSQTVLAVDQLKPFMPQYWQAYLSWYLAIEQRYFYYLGAKKYEQAYLFSTTMIDTFQHHSLPTELWQERSGDTALLLHQPNVAIDHYLTALHTSPMKRVELRLSDAYYLIGDYDKEREYRESVYLNFGH